MNRKKEVNQFAQFNALRAEDFRSTNAVEGAFLACQAPPEAQQQFSLARFMESREKHKQAANSGGLNRLKSTLATKESNKKLVK